MKPVDDFPGTPDGEDWHRSVEAFALATFAAFDTVAAGVVERSTRNPPVRAAEVALSAL